MWRNGYRLVALVLVGLAASQAAAQQVQHFKLGPDWETGEGFFVVVEEVEIFEDVLADNRVLVAAALDNTDPKHAWVPQDFGNNFTVRCDVRMESWMDGEDLSRAGIAALINPDPAPDGEGDRGVNLLFHQDLDNVEYLNDLVAWGDTNDNQFPWEIQTWYTFELTIVDGAVAEGRVYLREEGPESAFELDPWEFPNPEDRVGGFPGVTASTLEGLMVSFDNFQVLVDGEVVFEDDFEGELESQPQTVGLSDEWVAGEGGVYVVKDGQLFGIATNFIDPKHVWYDQEIEGSQAITADIRMLSWINEDDLSRAGVALHIQPHGEGGGRMPNPDFGPGEDRAQNMLFHENTETVEFLNDRVAWANLEDNTIPWEVGTWYTFDFVSDAEIFILSGTLQIRDESEPPIMKLEWFLENAQIREGGFAGLTGSTMPGLIVAWDNVEIRDGEDNVLFSDDFETFVHVKEWSLY